MSEYGVRINRAMNFAQERLPSFVSLEEVASVASFSPYHFHRVFVLVVGDTFANFMRKRRLEWAAMELLSTQRRILDISLDAGYETQESFARAFKQHFILTPGQYRMRGNGPTDGFNGLMAELNAHVGGLMKPEVKEFGGFELVGIQRGYDFPDFSGALSQWQAFLTRSSELKNEQSDCLYGVSVIPTRTRQHNGCSGVFKYLVAMERRSDDVIPEGMETLTVPRQKYAKYVYSGPVSGFQAFIMNVWAHYLPDSGLEVVEAPELEVYGEGFDMHSHDSEMTYLVPVR